MLYSRRLHSCLSFCPFRLLRKVNYAVELLLLCSVEKWGNESKHFEGNKRYLKYD